MSSCFRRWLLPLCLAAALAAPAAAYDLQPQDAPAACGGSALQIRVTIRGVTAQGILTVELYRPSERDFLRKASRLKRVRVPAEIGSQTVCFDVPGPGRYALAAYHDLDADGKLARKLNMLPAEPFALSKGKVQLLRFPKFNDAAFEVGSSTADIRMTLQR